MLADLTLNMASPHVLPLVFGGLAMLAFVTTMLCATKASRLVDDKKEYGAHTALSIITGIIGIGLLIVTIVMLYTLWDATYFPALPPEALSSPKT